MTVLEGSATRLRSIGPFFRSALQLHLTEGNWLYNPQEKPHDFFRVPQFSIRIRPLSSLGLLSLPSISTFRLIENA